MHADHLPTFLTCLPSPNLIFSFCVKFYPKFSSPYPCYLQRRLFFSQFLSLALTLPTHSIKSLSLSSSLCFFSLSLFRVPGSEIQLYYRRLCFVKTNLDRRMRETERFIPTAGWERERETIDGEEREDIQRYVWYSILNFTFSRNLVSLGKYV